MSDDPRSRKPPAPRVPTALVERPSGRVHRDHRRPSEGESDEDDGGDLFPEDEVSGVYEGEELLRRRRARPTAKRLERLETKHDNLAATVTDIKVKQAASHGELSGKLDTLVSHAAAASVEREKRAAEDATERERKRRHVVPIIKALGVAIALIAAALIGYRA